MKQVIKAFSYKTFVMFLMLTFTQALVWAQDSTVKTTTTTNSTSSSNSDVPSNWYEQWWVWVIGGAILLLIIVALMRGGGNSTRSDKVTVTKSIKTDTDV